MNGIDHQGRFDDGARLTGKPFCREQLALGVVEALQPPSAAAVPEAKNVFAL